jgi:hypothetical protein
MKGSRPPRATIRKWSGATATGRNNRRIPENAQIIGRFFALSSHFGAWLGSDRGPGAVMGPAPFAFEEPVPSVQTNWLE